MRNVVTEFLFLSLIFTVISFANVDAKVGEDNNALMNKALKLQMPFIENKGQIKDKSVRFYANTFAGIVFITDKGEIVYSLVKSEDGGQKAEEEMFGS